MTPVLTGQLILGTDKRNPLFTVYTDEDEEQEQLHVYYGLELLEVVSADSKEPSFKMLVGRLYNAGLSRTVLQRTFQVDLKTMQRWGRALRSQDSQELIRLLAGRRGGRKLTAEIEAYVRVRWPQLSVSGTYGISGRLRQEIQSVFQVKLSHETLRRLVGELKRQPATTPPRASEEEVPTTADGLPETDQASIEGQGFSCPTKEALFKQWLASLLLGALNIEQTKFLNWEDLSVLLGSVVRFPHPQRQELERAATEASFQALARFNSQQMGADRQSDFYFDLHTKHYTGEQNVLEGWCPAIRWADKAMHSDFIHTAAGQPLYLETTDNFADLRERFFGVVERARTVLGWSADRVLTWVVDRGIFGSEVFEKILAHPALHLMTWEKGYQAQPWPPPSGLSGSMVIERARNRADDIRSYRLEYWDRHQSGHRHPQRHLQPGRAALRTSGRQHAVRWEGTDGVGHRCDAEDDSREGTNAAEH